MQFQVGDIVEVTICKQDTHYPIWEPVLRYEPVWAISFEKTYYQCAQVEGIVVHICNRPKAIEVAWHPPEKNQKFGCKLSWFPVSPKSLDLNGAPRLLHNHFRFEPAPKSTNRFSRLLQGGSKTTKKRKPCIKKKKRK